MMRLDIWMHTNGMTPSRKKAQDLIAGGSVYVNRRQIRKAAHLVSDADQIEILGDVMPYVGRGGYKLAHALQVFSVDVSGKRCADIGASTGGFTDCLLQNGAAFVYAIDSGSDQLDASLRGDARVRSMEKCNARYCTHEMLGERVDIAVCDVSFISLTKLFGAISDILKPEGLLVALVKPQFEVGKENLNKNGIVKDQKVAEKTVRVVLDAARGYGLYAKELTSSPILGGDGNAEYLALFSKTE